VYAAEAKICMSATQNGTVCRTWLSLAPFIEFMGYFFKEG